MDPFFVTGLLAAVVGGATTGALGVYVVGMRLPMAALAIAHAAMLGAVVGVLVGWPTVPCAMVLAGLVSASLAVFRPELGHLDPASGLAVVFSLLMGLVFLGMGVFSGPANEVLVLMWGNVLLVDRTMLALIAAGAAGLALFVWLLAKELQAVMFSRYLARATGVREGLVVGAFLGLAGLVITVNLYALGGLMIYSLLVNPAAAAFHVVRGHRAVLVASIAIGVASAAAGFAASLGFDLPTGAAIVLASAAAFGLAVVWRRISGRRD